MRLKCWGCGEGSSAEPVAGSVAKLVILPGRKGFLHRDGQLWYCIFAQVAMTAIFQFVIFYPPSAVMKNNQSYVDVLSTAPRLVLFGTLAMFAGDIANNYVLAKMKVWTSGLYISARFVSSTLCGQTVNTAVFYIFALWGIMAKSALTRSIIVASLAKVSVELILLPVTLKISSWLKRSENVDFFDNSTDFNPLKFLESSNRMLQLRLVRGGFGPVTQQKRASRY